MTRSFLILFALALAAPALAQSGDAGRQSDLSPAAPTKSTGPDSGQSYQYPPKTGAIVRPENRTPYESGSSASRDANTTPAGSTGPAPATTRP